MPGRFQIGPRAAQQRLRDKLIMIIDPGLRRMPLGTERQRFEMRAIGEENDADLHDVDLRMDLRPTAQAKLTSKAHAAQALPLR